MIRSTVFKYNHCFVVIRAIFVFAFCLVSVAAQESVPLFEPSLEAPVSVGETIYHFKVTSSESPVGNTFDVSDRASGREPIFKFHGQTDSHISFERTFRNFENSATDISEANRGLGAFEDREERFRFDVGRKDPPKRTGKINDECTNRGRFGVGTRPSTKDRSCSELENPKDIDKDAPIDDPSLPPDLSFQWGPAIRQSMIFLAVQHGYATTQPKTRKALKDGNFLVDYYRSVKSLHGWDDGGRMFTNYIAHPMQGAVTGFIQIQNDPKGRTQQFGASKEYWRSRTKAFLWTTAWSTQFEIGPLSQASIGNVGLTGKQTWGDIVVTPILGTGWVLFEDMLDRYVIKKIERKNNFALKMISRIIFNPVRTSANLLRFKQPWYRDRQPGH